MDEILREYASTVYGVSAAVARLEAQEPESTVLAAGAAKARRLAGETAVRSGFGWATARRATLILTKDKLVCGSWTIPLVSIEEATLLRVRGLVSKGLVLKISIIDGIRYQFGLQYDPAWEQQTALRLTLEEGKIERSAPQVALAAIGLILMLAGCGYCGWFLYLVVSALTGGGF